MRYHLQRAVGGRSLVQRGRIAVCLACAVTILGLAVWVVSARLLAHLGYDFRAYLAYLEAAQSVAAGQNPYHRLIVEYGQSHGATSGVAANGYVYPPLLALLLSVPLRLGVSAEAVWVLWNIVGCLAVFWMGYECNLTLRARRSGLGAAGFFLCFVFSALAIYDISLGQADMLVAALAVGAESLRLRRHALAPLALAAAIAIKPTLGVLLLVWLWRGDWRAATRGALGAAALLLVPFVFVGGWSALRDYVTFLGQWNGLRDSTDFLNQSIAGVTARALTGNPYTVPLVNVPRVVPLVRYGLTAAATLVWLASVSHARLPSTLSGAWQRVSAPVRGRLAQARPTSERASTPQATSPRDAAAYGPTQRSTAFCEYLLAFPLILLASPLSEDIHFCLLLPMVVCFAWLVYARGYWRAPAAWALGCVLVLLYLPRVQEFEYPTHLFAWPGQYGSVLSPAVVLLRTSLLCLLAAVALIAGSALLRRMRAEASSAGPRGGISALVERGGQQRGEHWQEEDS